MTQAQIDVLGDELTDQIVAVDEAHYGQIGLADPLDPNSDALVLLAYNVQDDVVLRLQRHDVHRRLLRPGVHQRSRHERDRDRHVRLGESCRRDRRASSTRASSPTSSSTCS